MKTFIALALGSKGNKTPFMTARIQEIIVCTYLRNKRGQVKCTNRKAMHKWFSTVKVFVSILRAND